MAHDLTRDELGHALRAWIYLAGFAEPLPETLPASLAWLRARWDAGDDHLPLHLVHDLGYLLLRGRDFRFGSTRNLERWPESERAPRLAYEDRVLGRWALDPTVLDAHVVIAGFAPQLRDAAVAHAVGLALSRALHGSDAVVLCNPAHLRAISEKFVKETPARFEELAAMVDPVWVGWAIEQLGELFAHLPTGRLFRPEDLWEIAHLPDLPNDSTRLALREINGLAARVGPVPPSVALAVRHTAREVPVEAEDSDHYPAGGFDAISTRGTFENLVRTEVSYVGEGAVEEGGVDLFDVRFAENELLFYTRDESPLLDARHDLTAVIDFPSEQRHKQPALASQTLVLVEATILALQADLLRVFGPSGSRVRIVWRCEGGDDRDAATEERALLALTLAAEIAHRRVELGLADAWGDVTDTGRVVFSPRAPDANVAHVAWVRVGDDVWSALDERFDLREGSLAMRALCDRLLVAVVRRRVTRGARKKKRKAG